MSKNRIAPMNQLSTPQMELNGAVLSKRGRKVIETEMRFKFEKVLHIVDSETVLNMLHKVSTRFKLYEGVRVGEIQAATEGDMSCWAWISGKLNIADLLTRGCKPMDLNDESEWWNGPKFLYSCFDDWGLKFGLQREGPLPGEKNLKTGATTHTQTVHATSSMTLLPENLDFSRFSKFRSLIWVVARLIGVKEIKSFRGGSSLIASQYFQDAEVLVIRAVQQTASEEMSKKKGMYSRLHPVLDDRGLWVIGSRLKRHNPMTPESDPQILLPCGNYVAHLLMKEAHELGGHRGRDSTLARFRQRFWVPHGSKLAWKIKSTCQLCKLRDHKLLEQEMGLLPEERLKPSPPFTMVMLDLFGPYGVRGEVQKRTTGKAYGVIFVDMVTRAIHLEAVFGYDTSSFLMALTRFVSIRGWPSTIYSDPGSQLVGAERELREAWSKIDRSALVRKGTENGLKWVFGPANSPWHQGLVEALVKSVKRSIHFAVYNQRLSASEFLTLCSEVANLLNERPIGTLSGQDSDLSVLTPNSLLLGRATAKNPGQWQPSVTSPEARFRLVQGIVDKFWERWTESCAPALVVQSKWRTSSRNLRPGDVVIVSDRNTLKGEYRLALVKEVFPGDDGLVRKVLLMYKNYKVGDRLCKSGTEMLVTRSIQRLALLVPVDGN